METNFIYKIIRKKYQIFKLIFLLIILFPLNLFFLISYLIPRKKNKWVLSSWEGEAFRGNNRYLYEFLQRKKDVIPIWITKNKKLYHKLSLKDVNIIYAFSIKGIFTLLTARVIFFSHGLYDIIPYFAGGSMLICLGHVTYPIKKMGFSKQFYKMHFFYKLEDLLVRPYNYVKPNYEIVASKNTKNSAMFLLNDKNKESKRILPLGLPKSDFLKNISSTLKDKKKLFSLKKSFFEISEKNKLILFLPTWRGNKNFDLFGYNFDQKALEKILIDNDAYMIINFHPFDENLRLRQQANNLCKRIHTTSYNGDEIIKLLSIADVFITDYSSLYSDFLIFNRPIIFAKFSHLEYLREREFQIDYDTLPGQIVANWKELEKALNEFLSLESDPYEKNRKIWTDLIYSETNDGKSCERIYNFVKKEINL